MDLDTPETYFLETRDQVYLLYTFVVVMYETWIPICLRYVPFGFSNMLKMSTVSGVDQSLARPITQKCRCSHLSTIPH